MSRSTIPSKSLVESIRSYVSTTRVHDPALVIDLKSEPFKDPTSSIDYATLDLEVEPLGSPATFDYYGGSEFFEEGPLGDDPSDDTSGTNESPPA
ncbi:hypothetical protein Tco_1353791 [Tanacetum coccineum]